MSTDTRTLFMGMPGLFSNIVLEGLFTAGVTVAAVLLPGQQFRRLRPAIVPSEGIRQREGESLDLPLLNSPVSGCTAGQGKERHRRAEYGGPSLWEAWTIFRQAL